MASARAPGGILASHRGLTLNHRRRQPRVLVHKLHHAVRQLRVHDGQRFHLVHRQQDLGQKCQGRRGAAEVSGQAGRGKSVGSERWE